MVPYWRLSAYYFFYFAFIGAFSPFFTLYLQSLKFSAWDIGVLMSLMQVMRLLAPNLWGWLADRLGAKTPIVRGAALMSLAGFSCFFFAQGFAGVTREADAVAAALAAPGKVLKRPHGRHLPYKAQPDAPAAPKSTGRRRQKAAAAARKQKEAEKRARVAARKRAKAEVRNELAEIEREEAALRRRRQALRKKIKLHASD